jgi:hypothetical protein
MGLERVSDEWLGIFGPPKKQGRRRSITPTTLPAPDIEIGSRHPVKRIMPRTPAGRCDPLHIWPEKKLRGFVDHT